MANVVKCISESARRRGGCIGSILLLNFHAVAACSPTSTVPFATEAIQKGQSASPESFFRRALSASEQCEAFGSCGQAWHAVNAEGDCE
jgi:hypothetical protein